MPPNNNGSPRAKTGLMENNASTVAGEELKQQCVDVRTAVVGNVDSGYLPKNYLKLVPACLTGHAMKLTREAQEHEMGRPAGSYTVVSIIQKKHTSGCPDSWRIGQRYMLIQFRL